MTPGERALLEMADIVPWERAFLAVGIVALALFCLVMMAALVLMAPAVRTAVRELLGLEE
jgi:hypothetical protein